MHLDGFQRITVDPCSVTIISYTETRPFLVRLNEPVGPVVPPPAKRRRKRDSDAAVGGGAGA
jgi:hypothetical protein